MPRQKKIGKIFWLIITVVPIILIIVGFFYPTKYENFQLIWQRRIEKYGAFGPVVFVAIQILQVVVTPISHYAVGILGGFLYGPFIGGFLNYIGRIIGHITAFCLARIFGRRIVEKFVDDETRKKYDKLVAGETEFSVQSFILFLMYFLPLFPDDEISYIVGLSNMKLKVFLLANIFGHLCGAFSLSYIGSGINTKDWWFWVLFLINLFGFPILWILMKKAIKK